VLFRSLKKALDTVKIDDAGNVIDPATGRHITSLETAFNSRKIFSAFDENTGEIFLVSRERIVPFEKAVRKNKIDSDVKIFDPRLNRDLSINDAFEHGILDKRTGMIIDPKGGSLLSIKEAVKRGVVSINGAPVVTGHHDSEATEHARITSRKERHLLQPFDDVIETTSSTKTASRADRNIKARSTASPQVELPSYDDLSGLYAFTRRRDSLNSQKKKSSDSVKLTETTTTSTSTTRKKTPIVYDIDMTTTVVNENQGLGFGGAALADRVDSTATGHVFTKITKNNKEVVSRFKNNEVVSSVKEDFKETVYEPGKEPQVTNQKRYENVTKAMPSSVLDIDADASQ